MHALTKHFTQRNLHINIGSTKKQKSNEKLEGKGRWKGSSSKTPPTAETEAPKQSDEEQEKEIIQEDVPEPRTQELHSEPEDNVEKTCRR